jgi:ubiquitin-protein ligase
MGYVKSSTTRRKGKEADHVPSFPRIRSYRIIFLPPTSNTCLQYNRPADTLYEGAILRARLIFPEVSPPPPLNLADVQEYPLQPPKMIFDSEMWHPNVYSTSDKKGEVCISILVSFRLLADWNPS